MLQLVLHCNAFLAFRRCRKELTFCLFFQKCVSNYRLRRGNSSVKRLDCLTNNSFTQEICRIYLRNCVKKGEKIIDFVIILREKRARKAPFVQKSCEFRHETRHGNRLFFGKTSREWQAFFSAFFEKSSIFCSFFSPDCPYINDFFNLFCAI